MNIKTITRRLPFIIAIISPIVVTHYYINLFMPSGQGAVPVLIEFEQDAAFRQIANSLSEKGLIKDKTAFILLARLRGSTRSAQAGEYEFSASMSPARILEKLEKGLVVRHLVTIPEGYNIRDIADLLEKRGLCKKEKFLAKASDKAFLIPLGIDAPTVEGFLFPDTYNIYKGETEGAMIINMVSRFREALTDDLKKRAVAAGLSINDLLTLASVVEKETGQASERPRIARVFLNRLKKGMMLQSDPTVIYGIKDFNGNLTKKDLLTKTPYNTYRRRGLPAGPIANPGLDSIKAVLYPEHGPYLYFVSQNGGTHYFSKTLSEHNRAVYQYQIAGRRNNTKKPRRHGEHGDDYSKIDKREEKSK
ncbi:MAG: endolytic transglycosylase MltG [Deltaproteobacteria bacterium]|nr:endolytic transglycosylase MltG [Deltaproteobacteria bacterium]